MRRYWVIAALLHIGLFGVLMLRFDWWQSESPEAPAAIQATLVSAAELGSPGRKEKESQEALRKQEQAAELKRQQEAEKKRQEQKKAEEEKRRQKEAQAKREEAERQKRIALEEKRRKAEEEKRKQAEEARRKKAEEERRRKAEEEARRKKAEEEKRKRAEEARRKKAEEERRRREAERKRREAALKSQLEAEEAFLEGEAQRKNQVLIARYMARIRTKVESRWLEPPSARPGMSSTVRIRLAPSGEVLVVVTVASSGDSVFDRSVEAAVQKASPLPLPPDPTILPGFPELNFNFKK